MVSSRTEDHSPICTMGSGAGEGRRHSLPATFFNSYKHALKM